MLLIPDKIQLKKEEEARKNSKRVVSSNIFDIHINCSIKPFVFKLFLLLASVEFVVIALDIPFSYFGMIDIPAIQAIFNATRENTLVAWFSSFAFLYVSAVFLCYWVAFKQREPFYKRVDWLFFALVFLFFSIDDTASIHERMGTALAQYAKINQLDNSSLIGLIYHHYPSYYWQAIFIPPFVLLGVCMLIRLWQVSVNYKFVLLIIVSFGLAASAQGIDFIETYTPIMNRLTSIAPISQELFIRILMDIEEFLEMLAMTLLGSVLLYNLLLKIQRINIAIK